MAKRTDIKKILIIGSGPIIIGQACEFDYSGTQACKVLREEGYKVILVNSNPATIMTDPEFADRTYIEPITPEMVGKIIERERPDVLLPTLGGQTGLNVAVTLADNGVLDKFGVELIGAKVETIKKAEDRSLFKNAMAEIGLYVPRSDFAYSVDEATSIAEKIGFPLVIRPSFTLGGTGGGIAFDFDQLKHMAEHGLSLSPIGEVLIEESVIGWKEYELEVMRDKNDNVVIVCTIENFDPMGVHTGDSITVAPAQTLSDAEFQTLRDMSIKIMNEIGVETGGSNIQFAIHPETGQIAVIEMNPRVSRSSALASKATGFPIAKIAAKLAVGYTLDEIPNDITKKTPACFEPTIDYVVVKIPRWAFEKFPTTDATLTTRMKSVGEAMAIGRTFKEALQKAVRSLEMERFGIGWDNSDDIDEDVIGKMLKIPNQDRLYYVRAALEKDMSIAEINELTKIDPWFLDQIRQIIEIKKELSLHVILSEAKNLNGNRSIFKKAKQAGFSDVQLANILETDELEIRNSRKRLNIVPVYKSVDTCAAEFEAYTPYYYSTYEIEDEVRDTKKQKVLILGSGPNRIGQGVEFDYCCVHASFALREMGYESIMVNSNPETVSTDYDTSDRLYFEPLTFEDVLNIIEREKPIGIIVQLGGQTPLKLAKALEDAGANILGTSTKSINTAEDREEFGKLLKELEIPFSPYGMANSIDEAKEVAHKIGFPVLVRPSYVLGGRAMEIVYSDEMIEKYMTSAVKASPEHPVLIDKFLEGAIELDVDALFDGETFLLGGVMEHIEEAGIHSGDSACALPPHTIGKDYIDVAVKYTEKMARVLDVRGLINVQMAIKDGVVYVLEVNPRASRTVPFVSKATGVPLARIATKIMLKKKIKELNIRKPKTGHIAVKEAVLPFNKFPGEDIVLGPEMKSTGEVMGIDSSIGIAFAKSQMGAGAGIPKSGNIFISVCDKDKKSILPIAKKLNEYDFKIYATSRTARVFEDNGIEVSIVKKVSEGKHNVIDLISNGDIDLVINTPFGRGARSDGYQIRTLATQKGIPCITTVAGAKEALQGISEMRTKEIAVKSLQEYLKDD